MLQSLVEVLHSLVEDWHQTAYLIIFLVMILAYVLHFFSHGSETIEKIVSDKNILILLSIFVLVFASNQDSENAALRRGIDGNEALIKSIVEKSGYAKISQIAPSDIFSSLVRDLSKATSNVVVTSILHEPPSVIRNIDLENATRWYMSLPQWGNAQGHHLDRLIAVTSSNKKDNDPMYNWFLKECESVKNPATYALRSLLWDRKTQILNLVAFDNKRMYFILFPAGEQLNDADIILIEDETLTRSIIRNYFDQLLANGSKCPQQHSPADK